MKKLLIGTLLISLSWLAQADYREIQRVQVQHCRSLFEAPPVVVINPVVDEEGNYTPPDVEIEGDVSPEVTCQYFDSAKLYSVAISGSLATRGEPMTQIDYRARLVFGNRLYSVADMTDTVRWSSNGSNYRVTSWTTADEDGPLEYDITFNRRATSHQIVEVDGEEHWVPNYDAVTSITVEKRRGNDILLFTLWYKEPQVTSH